MGVLRLHLRASQIVMKEKRPLSQEDRRQLRSKFRQMVFFTLLIGAVFSVFLYYFMGDVMAHTLKDPWALGIIGCFALIFCSVLGYLIWSWFIDLKRGFKYRIQGTVTNKRIDVRKTGGAGTRSKSRTTRHYYLEVDGEAFTVDCMDYTQVRVGDRVVMDKAPKSNQTLNLKVENVMLDAERDRAKQEEALFLQQQFRKEPMTQQDFDVLKRKLWRVLRTKLIFMSPLLLIIFMLVYSHMGGLLLFLFPIPIIVAVQGIGMAKRIYVYHKNRREAHKIKVPALVVDKREMTGNGHNANAQLQTTWGNLAVDLKIYQSIAVGSQIYVYKMPYGKVPLALSSPGFPPHYAL